MKNSIGLFLSVVLISTTLNAADDALSQIDKLGGNEELYQTATAIQGQTEVKIVQNRTVNRNGRWEIAPVYESYLGGDSYNKTESFGMNVNFHFSPRWSLGLKAGYMANKLSKEGENLINDMEATGTGIIPAIDYPKSQGLVVVNWYPIYGKVAFLNSGVAQFDIYPTINLGSIELKSRTAQTWAAGLGLGVWMSQHWSARAEIKYQTFMARDYVSDKKMDMTNLGFQVGYLL